MYTGRCGIVLVNYSLMCDNFDAVLCYSTCPPNHVGRRLLCDCHLDRKTPPLSVCSGYRAPFAGNEDPALHRLDERHRLVNRLAPSFNTPALFTTHFTLLEVWKLP
jgi:hypothetical protein